MLQMKVSNFWQSATVSVFRLGSHSTGLLLRQLFLLHIDQTVFVISAFNQKLVDPEVSCQCENGGSCHTDPTTAAMQCQCTAGNPTIYTFFSQQDLFIDLLKYFSLG